MPHTGRKMGSTKYLDFYSREVPEHFGKNHTYKNIHYSVLIINAFKLQKWPLRVKWSQTANLLSLRRAP